MANWTNRSAGTAPRNFTSTHVITFATDGTAPFTPTDGRLLVMVVAGPSANAWPVGWTERLQPSANTELSVATITASSTSSVTITLSPGNTPIAWAVYEYPAGTTWVDGASSSGTANGAAQPTATLGAAPAEVFYAASRRITTGGLAAQSATWPTGVTEHVDSFTDDNGTVNGVWLGIGYQAGAPGPTATVTPTITAAPGAGTGTERVTFALALTSPTTVLAGAATALTLSVQVAWGADLTAADSTWTWTDITADVLVDGGEQITYSMGRQDEAATSQPAACTLKLDNRAGAYSLGPQSSNWPYVKRNTPLRVRVGGDITTKTVFAGYVDSWAPEWDQSGEYAAVNVTASGVMRRLQQGRRPVLSSIRRAMRALISTNLIGYWPMEDGAGANYFSSDIPNHSPMVIEDPDAALPKFASADPFPCSDRLPNLNYAWVYAPIAPYTHTGELQVRALVEFPANGMNDGIQLISLNMDLSTTTVEVWTLSYGVGGTLRLDGTDPDGATLADSLTRAFDVDGQHRRVGFSLTQNGANIDYEIHTLAPTSGLVLTGLQASGTFAGVTLGRVTEVNLQRGFTAGEPVVGHVTVQNEATSIGTDGAQLNAYSGEGAVGRIERLCSENDIPCTVVGVGGDGPAMGPQSVTDVLSLLRECETADQGILYDGPSFGLTYRAHNDIGDVEYDQQLNAVNGRLRSFDPVDDDQQIRNRVTVTRSGGGTITRDVTTGALSIDAVGVYDDSITVNCETDAQLPDYAGWLLNLGTVEGYRLPQVELDLRDLSTTQVGNLLGLTAYSCIELINVATYRAQFPSLPIDMAAVGWSGAIDKHRWCLVYNTAPYTPLRVAYIDEGEELLDLRPNSTTSVLASSASAGATSLSVTVTGALWTTRVADFPMTIEVGDLPVTVSAISGASSPQTFTISALGLARSAGVSVALPRARPVLDLDDRSGY